MLPRKSHSRGEQKWQLRKIRCSVEVARIELAQGIEAAATAVLTVGIGTAAGIAAAAASMETANCLLANA